MWLLRNLHFQHPEEAVVYLKQTLVDDGGIAAMLPKMSHLNIHIDDVPSPAANIIKQEMLAVGGDAAVARGTVSCRLPTTDVILMGTKKQLTRFAGKISRQPFGLPLLAESLLRTIGNLEGEVAPLRTARRDLVLGERTLLMGILNVTPDSFSDGGRYFAVANAVDHARRLVEDGADIVDIGGESSRPGALPVSTAEEINRVVPVIEALAGKITVPLSVDTTKAAVARAAVTAGAEIVNDISAMRFDPEMAATVRDSGAAVVLMHMRGTPRDMQEGDLGYKSLWGEIIGFLAERIAAGVAAGIPEERMMIDPGLGFGKTAADNLKLINGLPECRVLGRPILMGPSRKSFLGTITGSGPDDRGEETAAAVTACILRGAQVVRVHDVQAMKKVVAVADALRGSGS